MINPITFILLCLLGVTGSLAHEFLPADDGGGMGVILPVAYVEKNRVLFQDGKVKGAWLPTQADIQKANARLVDHLASLDARGPLRQDLPSIRQSLKISRWQYAGLIIGTVKMIHMRALPPAPETGEDRFPNWRREYPLVFDGGSDFWQVDFDLKSGTFSNLIVNPSP